MSSSKLSADVPPFIPKSYMADELKEPTDSKRNAQDDRLEQIPAYMTNCYPFVQEPTSLNNPHWQTPIYPPRGPGMLMNDKSLYSWHNKHASSNRNKSSGDNAPEEQFTHYRNQSRTSRRFNNRPKESSAKNNVSENNLKSSSNQKKRFSKTNFRQIKDYHSATDALQDHQTVRAVANESVKSKEPREKRDPVSAENSFNGASQLDSKDGNGIKSYSQALRQTPISKEVKINNHNQGNRSKNMNNSFKNQDGERNDSNSPRNAISNHKKNKTRKPNFKSMQESVIVHQQVKETAQNPPVSTNFQNSAAGTPSKLRNSSELAKKNKFVSVNSSLDKTDSLPSVSDNMQCTKNSATHKSWRCSAKFAGSDNRLFSRENSNVSKPISSHKYEGSESSSNVHTNLLKESNSNSSVIYKSSDVKGVKKQSKSNSNVPKHEVKNISGKVHLMSPQLLNEIQNTNQNDIKILKNTPTDNANLLNDEAAYPSLSSSVPSNSLSGNDVVTWPAVSSDKKSKQSSKLFVESSNESKMDVVSKTVPVVQSLSFSDVLKRPAQPKKKDEVKQKSSTSKNESASKKASAKKVNTKNTKKSNKKTKSAPKARSAISFDISEMINKIQEKKIKKIDEEEVDGISKDDEEIRKVKLSSVRVLAKKENIKSIKNTLHNVLDSSAPVRMRGKEREIPKKKKATRLKKVILLEREEKKQRKIDNTSQNQKCSSSSDINATVQISEEFRESTVQNSEKEINDGKLIDPVSGVSREAKSLIHSRRFREYCDQFLDSEIDEIARKLLDDLVRFQDRLYQRDPVKAKAKRRIVLGLREVTKHVTVGKIKCLIIAPNLEKIQSKGGLDDTLQKLITLANDRSIPFVFAHNKRTLGRICKKVVSVSCIGIFNYDGSEENFKQLMQVSSEARSSYSKMLKSLESELTEKVRSEKIPNEFSVDLEAFWESNGKINAWNS